jgi:hypothetical protein
MTGQWGPKDVAVYILKSYSNSNEVREYLVYIVVI